MKVVHLMGSLAPSGMERMFISAAEYLFEDKSGSRVSHVIVCQGESHTYIDELERAGYEVVRIPPLRTVRGWVAYSRVLRRLQPDVSHIHTEGQFLFAVLLARLSISKLPVVRTVHNVFPTGGRPSLSRRMQSWLCDRLVAEFVAPSPDVASNESRIGRRCRVIYNWVDSSFFESSSNSGATSSYTSCNPSVAIVGNSSNIKNQEVALTAIEFESVDVYFHGSESNASNRLIELLDGFAESGRLRYRGTGDPKNSLANCSAFVMPSRREGMPVALAEALVMGCPCVITDAPGLRWAASLPGVYTLAEDQDVWTARLTSDWLGSLSRNSNRSGDIDFRPGRGAKEYLQLYEAVLAEV